MAITDPKNQMPMSFSLLTESWIPLVAHDGTRTNGSLHDVLLTPAKWRGVGTTKPTEVLALYRLLLAICHRAIGHGNTAQRADLLDNWPGQKLETYLDHWSERFDLFHPQYPFLQVPSLAEAGLKKSPWTRLTPERACGNNRLLWDRSLDAQPDPITPAQAAVALVAHLQFTTGGLVRALRQPSGCQGLACGLFLVLPTGKMLQETLALSLVQQTAEEYDRDWASWEKPAPSIQDIDIENPRKTVPAGPANRYTWLSRALLFQQPEFGTSMTYLRYAAGLVPEKTPSPDPMAAMVKGEKCPFPLKLDESRAMWRDFHALTGDKGQGAPQTIHDAVEIRMEQGDFDPVPLLAGGLLPNQAKLVLWRLEEWHVPPALLAVQGEDIAGKALALAESADRKLRKEALRALFSDWLQNGGARKPAGADVNDLLNSTQVMAHYWAALEADFWQLVDRLGQKQDDHQVVLDDWRATLKRVVWSIWNRAKSSLGTDGRALAAAGRSEKKLAKVFKAVAA